jgi:hypothetical protein
MTRGRSDPLSDSLSDGVELAALRGQVALVEAKLPAVRAGATSSPLSSSGSGWTTSGCGPASMP